MTVFRTIVAKAVFKNVIKSNNIAYSLLKRFNNHLKNDCSYSTANLAETNDQNMLQEKKDNKPLNKAMAAYLERAKAYDEFMKKETTEFEIGKRHLANIMGKDAENFTQKEIDNAIEYLLPSGLFDKAARPILRRPEDIHPPKKAAEFDTSGRPFHPLFYTTRPNYFQVLYDIVEEMQNLKKIEDENIKKGVCPDPNKQLDLTSSGWLIQQEFEKLILEEISEPDYEYFQATIDRLANHPYAYEAKDFIMKYRKPKEVLVQMSALLPLEYDSSGRPFVTVTGCRRKSAHGTVIVKGKGSGIITVNGKPLVKYFSRSQDVEQIVFPLHFTDTMDKFDVEASVWNGGPTGQSGCIRWGIAWALRSFVDHEVMEKMRIAGLLTRDWRRRERKKPGQEGARSKFTWKKR